MSVFQSHYRAGTGALCVESREELRVLAQILEDLPEAAVFSMTAPAGPITQMRFKQGTMLPEKVPGKDPVVVSSMQEAYAYIAKKSGQVLLVHDWHTLCNNAGSWRALIQSLPGIRCPGGADDQGNACLVIFVGPQFEFSIANPLRGSLPVLPFATPNRESLRRIVSSVKALPDGAAGERIIDAVCGLSSDVAEQCVAENLIANKGWHVDSLNEQRRAAIRQGGLEIWKPVAELGGLGGLKSHIETEVIPWIRDDLLAIRRILAAGLPGTGKSFFARWLAHRLGCECARLSIPSLKRGFVGESEANLRRALRVVDSMAAEAPLVVVLDEIDKVATEGADGGASSGMWGEMLGWLQDSKSLCVVVATLNRLNTLDAAMESRFSSRLFFDTPSVAERRAVAEIHYRRVGIEDMSTVNLLADITDGYSNREIAEAIVPSIARRSNRAPTVPIVNMVVENTTPTIVTQRDQLEAMRSSGKSLLRANDPEGGASPGTRRVSAHNN